MKGLKKILAFTLALVIASAFVSCGGGKEDASSLSKLSDNSQSESDSNIEVNDSTSESEQAIVKNFYAYYYPCGVITKAEYETDLLGFQTALDAAKASEDQKKIAVAQKELDEYKENYVSVEGVNGLYFSTDEDDGVLEQVEDGKWVVSSHFHTAFNKAVEEIEKRYAAKNYQYYSISIENGYAVRVELGNLEKTEQSSTISLEMNASQAFTLFNMFGEFTFATDGKEVDALGGDVTVKDLIKEIDLKIEQEIVYLQIDFTAEGKHMVDTFKESKSTALDIIIGDEKMLSIPKDYVDDKISYAIAERRDVRYAETIKILLNSLKDTGAIYMGCLDDGSSRIFKFQNLSASSIYAF